MQLKVPDFLKGDAEPLEQDALAQLSALVDSYQSLESNIEDLELMLKEEKEKLRRVSQEAIPELLGQHGLSEVRLKTGAKVIVKPQVSVSVPEPKRTAFHEFLKKRNEEDIIKLQMQFERMPQEQIDKLFAFLNENSYMYASERNVHPQTLKKYFRELLGLDLEEEERKEGVANGKLMRKEDLEAFASVFTFFDTKIK